MDSRPAASGAATLVTVCIVQFMAPFMLTAIGVALPTLGRDIGATAMQLGFVEQAYVVSLAMGMMIFGRYGDIVGQKRVFLPGVVIFTLFTCSLGLTDSVGMIIGQRVFQGLGACMMLSGSLALVAKAYPPEVRGRKIGIVSACTYAGLSMGPVIGGYITEHIGWRYVFILCTPFGVTATLACILRMREAPTALRSDRMDWTGGAFYAVSIALVMLGSAHAGALPLGPLLIAAGCAGIAWFVRLQFRAEHPLVDMKLLRANRAFSLSCLAALGNYAGTFGVTFLMSLYLQYAKGLSPREAGYILLLQPVMQILVSPLVGRFTDRFDPARLATLGMLLSSLGLLAQALTAGRDAPLWLLGGELALVGAGFGIFVTPNSTLIMKSVAANQLGMASGMVASMRTLGMAVSMTSITLIFSLFMGDAAVSPDTLPSFLASMRTGLVVFAVFASLGLCMSLLRKAG